MYGRVSGRILYQLIYLYNEKSVVLLFNPREKDDGFSKILESSDKRLAYENFLNLMIKKEEKLKIRILTHVSGVLPYFTFLLPANHSLSKTNTFQYISITY